MSVATHSLPQLLSEIEQQGLTPENAERLGKELAADFRVQPDEVGILKVDGPTLVFCYPARLQTVGRIPLNSSSSIAARSATTRRAEIINNFAQVKHTSFFEAVELSANSGGEKTEGRPRIIQKLMSAPILVGKRVRGVVQVSRKGTNLATAGPDFTPQELSKLVTTAARLANRWEQ